MPRPTRDQFADDNAYYWALSDYYESDEGEAAILEAMARGERDGTARYGAAAAAEGRKLLLEGVGLPADSEISTEELIDLALADMAEQGAQRRTRGQAAQATATEDSI